MSLLNLLPIILGVVGIVFALRAHSAWVEVNAWKALPRKPEGKGGVYEELNYKLLRENAWIKTMISIILLVVSLIKYWSSAV